MFFSVRSSNQGSWGNRLKLGGIGSSWRVWEGVSELEKVATFFAKKSEKKSPFSTSKSGTFLGSGGGVSELGSGLDSGPVGRGGLEGLGGCPDRV